MDKILFSLMLNMSLLAYIDHYHLNIRKFFILVEPI